MQFALIDRLRDEREIFPFSKSTQKFLNVIKQTKTYRITCHHLFDHLLVVTPWFWPLCLVDKMTLKVYVDYASQPCRALPMFFRVAKIPHEVVVLSFMKGEHKSEKITKLNLFGIVIQNFFFNFLALNFNFLLVAICWTWWCGLERIYGHFEVRHQGVWRTWSLVSQRLDGWAKSQWILALATFDDSSKLRHVFPGKNNLILLIFKKLMCDVFVE